MIQKDKTDEAKKWDKIWNSIWWFFALTGIIGGFTLAYFGERDQLGIMENKLIKIAVISFAVVAMFCITYSQVRTRSKATFKTNFWVTLFVLATFILFLIVSRILTY